MRFRADGYLETLVPVAGADIEVRLFRNTFAETVEVVSETTAQPRPSSTPIPPEEVFQVAGSVDNVFRTLDLLPGVAATDHFGSRLAVRGGTPDQNLTVMDGVEIHNPYRLFGITSAFNPETVESFQLTAGGFGVAYGDRLSSLLIVETRPGSRDFQGATAVSVTDGNVVLEGTTPLWDNGTWLFSARRTYYDLVAGPLLDQNFPSFADLQLQAGWEFGPGHRLTLTGLRSVEDADLNIDEGRPGETIRFGSDVKNDLASARLDAVLGSRGTSTTIVSWYRNRERLDFDGTIRADARRSNGPEDNVAFGLATITFDRVIRVRDISVRQAFDVQTSPEHLVSAGLEIHRLNTGVGFTITGDRNENEANGGSAGEHPHRAPHVAVLCLGSRQPGDLWAAVGVRVRPPSRVQCRGSLPAHQPVESGRHRPTGQRLSAHRTGRAPGVGGGGRPGQARAGDRPGREPGSTPLTTAAWRISTRGGCRNTRGSISEPRTGGAAPLGGGRCTLRSSTPRPPRRVLDRELVEERVGAPVERHDPGLVDHLGEAHDVVGRLEQLEDTGEPLCGNLEKPRHVRAGIVFEPGFQLDRVVAPQQEAAVWPWPAAGAGVNQTNATTSAVTHSADANRLLTGHLLGIRTRLGAPPPVPLRAHR